MLEVKEVLTGDISVKESLAGEINNGVKVISPPLIDLEVTPRKEKLTYKHEGSYGYDNVTVNPISEEYIIPSGTKDINSNGIHNINEYENVNVNVVAVPDLEEKVITPTKEVQTVVPSEGYDGLSEVTVNAIPDEYIAPSGELEITASGIYDVKEYASANVNVSGGGSETPKVGFVVNDWNSSGYATKITFYGMKTLPSNFIGHSNTNYIKEIIGKRLTDITINDTTTLINSNVFYGLTDLVNLTLPNTLIELGQAVCRNCQSLILNELPDTIEKIGAHAFRDCTKLALTRLPSNLTSMPSNAFYNCPNIKIKTIPDSLTSIGQNNFYNCTGLTQMSMRNVTNIYGNASTTSPFGNDIGLKAVWIGSAIVDETFYRYSFYGCTNIIKMFIDLPRATVESFANYQYAFSDNAVTTDVIVCNDDEGFMTKEEFDDIDWSTQ